MKTYRIAKGNHYVSGVGFKPHIYCEYFALAGSLTASCSVEYHEHWNKLLGASFGLHHSNSVRIAWRPSRMKLMFDIALYTYVDGKREIEQLEQVGIGEMICVEIYNQGRGLQIGVTTGDMSFSRYLERPSGHTFPKWGYQLNPYFGGKPTAPRDMEFKIAYSAN